MSKVKEMPRVRSLDPARRRLDRISDFIRREMRAQRITQVEMAAVIDVSQQAFSAKLRKGIFTAEDLIRIFDKLKTEITQIGDLLRNG